MTAYVRARFRVRVFGVEHLRVAQGAPWPTFAAMIELFLPGFFAGYPAGLPRSPRAQSRPASPGSGLRR
jgi:hypothetical protein